MSRVEQPLSVWLKESVPRLYAPLKQTESHQNGTAERMNCTLVTGARTVLLTSGLERRWWHHAVMYQTFLQNIKYSSLSHSSPHLMMFGFKPDASSFQEFGIEA
jgi:hypothetical protein